MSSALLQDLTRLLGPEGVSESGADRVAYARDMWPRQQLAVREGHAAPSPPSRVVWPTHTEQLASVLEWAAARGVPVVPFGGGSGVCGGATAESNGITLDLKRMHRVLQVDDCELECTAEAGILGEHLEQQLAARGLTCGHFPSSMYCSTLGGWIATRSAGQCSGRYGKIEDRVLGLTAVDGRGRVLEAHHDGTDAGLLPWLVGNEGTLAVVTRARLRIAPAPAARRFASYAFPTLEQGLQTLRHLYQRGCRPAVARLYDPLDTLVTERGGSRRRGKGARLARTARWKLLGRALQHPRLLNRLGHGFATEGVLLVLVWESDPELADAELAVADRLARDAGAERRGEQPARRWLQHRYAAGYRQSPVFASGSFADTMEVAATWSRLPAVYEAVRTALQPHALVMAHFSHAYPDGASVYFTFVGSGRGPESTRGVYERAWDQALEAVVDAGGTLSHHHGVGRSKSRALRREQGAAVDAAVALKGGFDPAGVLNPQTLLVPAEGVQPAARTAPIQRGASGRATGRQALLAELRHSMPHVLDSADRQTVLLPRSVPETAHLLQRARRLGAALRAPGAAPRPEDVPLDLQHLDDVLDRDETSHLVHAQAGHSVARLEYDLQRRGRTLGVRTPWPEQTVGQWLASGAPGGPAAADDPVAQLVAGLEALLPDGRHVAIRPAPRRALGPDLAAAMVGARGRLGILVAAHLVTRPLVRARTLTFLFPSLRDARSCRAWVRGQGARPLASRVSARPEGGRLWLQLPDGGPGAEAMCNLVRRCAEPYRGVEVTTEDRSDERTPAEPASPGATFEELARRLDPGGVLGD
jgi:alkyldihydroxyacetonephosphate synthase